MKKGFPKSAFTERLCGVHLDWHLPGWLPDAISNFNAEKMVGELAGIGCEVLYFFTKCHYGNSYYPTMVGHRHPCLRGDAFGEVVEECRRRNIAVIAYYSLGLDDYQGRTNSDWQCLKSHGELSSVGMFRMVCLKSPYWVEICLPQLREILSTYPVFGLFLDIAIQDLCWCPYCRAAWLQHFGRETPTGPDHPDWHAFCAWHLERLHTCIREARALIDELRPGVKLSLNGPFNTRQCQAPPPGLIDYLLMDPFNEELATLTQTFETRYWNGLRLPAHAFTTRFHKSIGAITLKPATYLKSEMGSMLATGMPCVIIDNLNVEGSLDPQAVKVMGEAFAFVRERAEWAQNTTSAASVALVHSWPTQLHRSLRNQGGSLYAASTIDNVRGAHKALVEGHFHYDGLPEDLLGERASEYEALVVPDQYCLSEGSQKAIREYVSEGGVLLASGRTSLCRADGVEREDFGLADVFGVGYLSRAPYSLHYIVPRTQEVWGDIPSTPIPVQSWGIKVANKEAEVLADLYYPRTENTEDRHFLWRNYPAAETSGLAAVTLNRYGKGRAIYVAGDLFTDIWLNSNLWSRHLVANLLAFVIPDRLVTLSASPGVEVSVRKQSVAGNERLLVHLVNSHEEKRVSGPATLEAMPIWEGLELSVRCESKPNRVVQQPEGKELSFQYQQGRLHVTVPRLHMHSIIVIEATGQRVAP